MTPNFSFILLFFYPILLFLCLQTTYASNESNKNYWKLPLAGGLAGGVTNAIIFPLDTIKTMMQTNSKLNNFDNIANYLSKKGISKIYSGFIPAVVGAIPSSALYFGTYEGIKRSLKEKTNWNRQLIHVISAASGNLASSFIFVPKEAIKQQLQAFKTGSLQSSASSLSTYSISKYIYQKSGIRGFYPSYFATLSRNVPSAIVRANFIYQTNLINSFSLLKIRFAIFEEFKILGKKFYGDKFEDTRVINQKEYFLIS